MLSRGLRFEPPVVFFADLHGHSRRRKNIFLYGCSSKVGPQTMRERVSPKMLSRTCDFFSFNCCSFKVQEAKEGTGRVVLWRELGITNSFTLEASLCGPDICRSSCCHFNVSHYLHLGFCFCGVILDFWDPDQPIQRRPARAVGQWRFARRDRGVEIVIAPREAMILIHEPGRKRTAAASRRRIRGRRARPPPLGRLFRCLQLRWL